MLDSWEEISEDFSLTPEVGDLMDGDLEIAEIPFIENDELGNSSPFTTPIIPETWSEGYFTVGETGQVSIDFLYDGGGYRGELALFSLEGMAQFEPGSEAFIAEAANRALSNSEWGRIVISDELEGAKLSGLGEWEPNFNRGEYQGIKTFSMRPGDLLGAMLVPNGTVQQVVDQPSVGGSTRPLFSLATANPEDGFQVGQIADVTGEGHIFVFEDLRIDGQSDRDYNDLIFQIKGATGKAIHVDEVIEPQFAHIDYQQFTSDTDTSPVTVATEQAPIIDSEQADTFLTPIDSTNSGLTSALELATEQLTQFREKPDAIEQLQQAFGDTFNPEKAQVLLDSVAQGKELPNIEIVSGTELKSHGAFAEATQTIYLSEQFLNANIENFELIAGVLLEEIGHYFDEQLNETDSPGDEGAIFAALVRGEVLDETQLEVLQEDNDRHTVILEGQVIEVERNGSTGTGLLGKYYDTPYFSDLKLTRTDAAIDFDWGGGSPDPALGIDTFTTRWTGEIEPLYGEDYTFYTQSDDGVRLWVNDQLLIDGWNGGGHRTSQPITLESGQKYDIKLEYVEYGGAAHTKLLWSSLTQTQEVVPTTQLYPKELPLPLGVEGTGTGLLGKYYDTPYFSDLKLTRTDAAIDFDWGGGSPDPALGIDTFTTRWTGEIEPLYGEDYTFYTQSDDGVRLWVNDQLLIDGWNGGGHRTSQPITLESGQKYDIKLEYVEYGGAAHTKLLWSSLTQTQEVVPTTQLYPKELPLPIGVEGNGNGLIGEYFNNVDLTDSSFFRTDAAIDFNWGSGSPDPSIEIDTFSTRWTGEIEPLYGEDYTFYTESDDGVRLWVNDQLLIDGSGHHTSQPITLQGGQKYDIKFEYAEYGGAA
ncbi:MAG: PA14 domain-containing protein, partial [Jaaginema sp. PMC 1078.18]|nr:PA14 domain-containing protein [Jaaginema sp. PMC 1078.18]